MIADKTKSIKNASDQEIDALLARIRKENELQMLIADLKRRARPAGQANDQVYTYNESEGISADAPIESLYHYGKLGMHWGKRGSRKLSSKLIASLKKKKVKVVDEEPDRHSDDEIKKNTLKRKKISEMSNEELKTVTTRLQLEKSYKDLNKSDVSAGKRFVTDVLSSSAKQTAATYATKAMVSTVEKIIAKKAK